MKKYFIAGFLALAFAIIPSHSASAYSWTAQTASGNHSWRGITTSGDGSKIAAVAYNSYVFTSTDGGVTWTAQLGSGVHPWGSIAGSSDGSKLIAANFYTGSAASYIFTSSDSGVTWTAQTGSGLHHWSAVASSSDGMSLSAVDYGTSVSDPGFVYTSTDGGATWSTHSGSSTGKCWTSIASSANGMNLIATAGAYVATSTDGGATWTAHSEVYGGPVSISADGSKMAILNGGGIIHISTDGGVTWSHVTISSYGGFFALASSADGTKLVAGNNGGSLFTSLDSGTTWSIETGTASHNWQSLAASNDGTKFFAGDVGGYVYSGIPFSFEITTHAATGITTDSAVIRGDLISTGGIGNAAVAFMYGTSLPYSSTVGTSGLTLEGYSASQVINSLACNTTYHYVANATNAIGTVHGSDMTFTTLPCPVVITLPASGITSSSVLMQGNLPDASWAPFIEVGFRVDGGAYWPISTGITAPAGIFSRPLSLLSCGTTHTYSVYAADATTIYPGADVTFTTLPCPVITLPVVVTNAASGITATNVNFNGNITSGTAVTSRGFKYATSPMYYAVAGGTVTQSSGPYGVGTFTAPINASVEFSCGYTYYFKAFATNSAGTAYGADQSFTTLPCASTTAKRIATNGTTAVTATTATLIGNLVSIPGTSAVTVGFQYGNTTAYGTTAAVGSRTSGGIYTKPLTGLLHNHLYHFRAYMSSSTGTIYGSDQTFTTLP